MQVKFYGLGEKNPHQRSAGRRYYALYATRVLDVDNWDLPALGKLAQPNEQAVRIGNALYPVLLPGFHPASRMGECLRHAQSGKGGYIIEDIIPFRPAGINVGPAPKAEQTLRLQMPNGAWPAANSLNWLAIQPGSVCEISGRLYQVQADRRLAAI